MAERIDVVFDGEAMEYLKEMIEVDKTIRELGRIASEEDSRPAFLNLNKERQISGVYAMACELFKGTNVKVYGELHKPMRSMGYVTLEGEAILFNDSKWLARLAEFANNFEVYPLTNGKIRLTYTFHGLTTPIK